MELKGTRTRNMLDGKVAYEGKQVYWFVSDGVRVEWIDVMHNTLVVTIDRPCSIKRAISGALELVPLGEEQEIIETEKEVSNG